MRTPHTRAIITGGGRDPDVVSELLHYQDQGCRYSPTCLGCPYPICLFEHKYGSRVALAQFRGTAIRAAYDAGELVPAIAVRFGLSERGVYHAIGSVRQRRAARKGAA